MAVVTVEALLEAGAHFGHLTRRWNPKMRNFIFMERNGIHIIDLRKTQLLLDIAREAAYDVASHGRGVLFVGTKNQARPAIEAEARRSGSNYVSERWLGGMLTNFSTIRKSIKRLSAIDKMEVDGTFEKITKKERLMLSRERERLRKVFGGIEDMTRIPGLLFVVDTKREHLAIKEAKILGIPVVGIVDTNSDPEEVDYPIPANDDSIHTIDIMAKVIADAVLQGREIARVKAADTAASGEMLAKETEQTDDGKVRRQMRGRRKAESGEAEG
ncbi:MAG: 30S ribosomal protein S2 [Chlorobi bacterium]|nr:MAG: 30S ribosomal protein S2 [Bacteroidota bacterium]KXK34204.1 MAG: 30S ribosomal protein S2 [Chlorobi bacterium OLB6]MBL1161076.1 30S ribosomal protein S2 [Chlorobiota bacterium]MBZ0193883.1 30S ribosomal protein S2 [Candidatus Kapabacteria bacterium]MCC6331020.1 30S ribosomal protein S2 [Ignavibacteria bacterium]